MKKNKHKVRKCVRKNSEKLQSNVPNTSGCWSSLNVSVLVAESVAKDEKMTKRGVEGRLRGGRGGGI